MKSKTKIRVALESMDTYALNRFMKFVDSPYFNSNSALQSFAEIVINDIKQEEETSKDIIWSHLFKGTPYNDSKFRKLNNDLLSLFERFLTIEEFEDDALNRPNFLIKYLTKNKIEKLYSSSLNKAFRLSERNLEKSGDYYYQQYKLQKNIFNLTTDFERKINPIDKDENIESINENLDVFYFTEKMKYYSTVLSWKKIITSKDDISFIEEIIEYVERNQLIKFLPIRTYYTVLKTLLEPENIQHFNDLKEIISKDLMSFPDDEAKSIFDAAQNYCIRKKNLGEVQFISEHIDLIRSGLKTNVLLDGQFLSPTTVRNITFLGLNLKEFDFVENFLADYAHLIEDKYRSSILGHNMALLSFYKKDYDSVLEHLRDYNYESTNYTLATKSLMLATYYELDEYDVLDTFLSSFKTYLRRKKEIPEGRRNNYLNLIKITGRILSLKPGDKDSLAKIENEVREERSIASKNWLMEKINELK